MQSLLPGRSGQSCLSSCIFRAEASLPAEKERIYKLPASRAAADARGGTGPTDLVQREYRRRAGKFRADRDAIYIEGFLGGKALPGGKVADNKGEWKWKKVAIEWRPGYR
ncbi:F box:lrr repeat protein 4 [Striga asiatica]|uniref:F box:lrr repeat protein 4 n=1 Tax=Striga asiatica TaxID=4170 RepID=A0A5A7QWL1_STRAF|nr:F box:lrr repeat protein 4 [Striga asiatica]